MIEVIIITVLFIFFVSSTWFAYNKGYEAGYKQGIEDAKRSYNETINKIFNRINTDNDGFRVQYKDKPRLS